MAHGAVAVMKVRAFLGTLAIAAVLTFGALAQSQPKPCTVESTTSEIFGHVVEIEGRSAKAMMPLLTELQTLTEKAKDPKKPIGAQLSVHDSQRFTEIADQMKSVRLSNFVESAHSRDAIFVEQMFQTAWTLYNSPGAAPPSTDVPGAFLVTMRLLFPSVEPDSVMTPSSCTVESALTAAEVDAETRAINDPAIARDFPVMQQLQAKYGVAPGGAFDPSKVTPDDSRVLHRIALSMQVAVQEQHLAQDIKNILDWWRMANLVYETRKEDIATYGPDMRALGNTIESQQGSFDDRTKIMLGLWGKVNERVPSDDVKMLNAMSPAIDAANKMVPPAE